MNFDLKARTVLLTVAGSRAYGLHTDTSDVDVKGVAIPPREYFLGYLHHFEQADKPSHMETFLPGNFTPEELDAIKREKIEGAIYNLTKFVKLAADCNPNILDVLFCRDMEVRHLTPLGQVLRENRDMFISAKAKHTFSGYAAAQLKRIRGHRRWLLNPPAHPPTREEYGLPEQTLIPKDHLAAVKASVRKKLDQWEWDFATLPKSEIVRIQGDIEAFMVEFVAHLPEGLQDVEDAKWLAAARSIGLNDSLIYVLQKEREYEAARRYWKQYQNWKKNRNPARAALEEKHGFDCYTDDTEFLTENGWKLFDEIENDVRLATIYVGPDQPGRAWGTIEYQTPIERFDGTFTGRLYRFTGHHVEVTVTPNHRMLSRHVEKNTGRVKAWKLEEASLLGNSFDFLRTVTPRTTRFSYGELFKDIPLPPVSYMRLMGWVLSDGTFTFHNDRVKSVRVSQKKGGKLSWRMARFQSDYGHVINATLYEYQREPNGFRSGGMIERILDIRHQALCTRLYRDCGHKELKRIPRWVFRLSKRLMESLFDGLIGGDGTKRSNGPQSLIYCTSLKGLADDVQELALHCGWETSLWGPYQNRHNSVMYQVHVNKNTERFRRLSRSRNIERIPVQDQRIVCFTVPNGTLVTRKNGKVAFHGNSKHGAHLVRLLRMGREILETGEVHVWRGGPDGPNDREELLAIRNGAWSYEDLVEWAEREDKELQALYRAGAYQIPKAPRREALDALAVQLVETALRGEGLKPCPPK